MKRLTNTWRQQKPLVGRENVKPTTSTGNLNGSDPIAKTTTTKRLGQHAVARAHNATPSTSTATPSRNMVEAKKRKVLSPKHSSTGQDHHNGGELRRSPRFKGGESGNQQSTVRRTGMKRRSPRLLQENDSKTSPAQNSSFNSSFGTDIDMNEDFLLALEQVEADYQDKHVEGQVQHVKGQVGVSRTEFEQSEQSPKLQNGNGMQKSKSGFVKFVKNVTEASAEVAIESGTKNVKKSNEGVKSKSNNSLENFRTDNSLPENGTNSLNGISSRAGSSSSAMSNQNHGHINKPNQASSSIKWTNQTNKITSTNASLANQNTQAKNLANQRKATHSVTNQVTNEIPAKKVSSLSTNQNKSSDKTTIKWTNQSIKSTALLSNQKVAPRNLANQVKTTNPVTNQMTNELPAKIVSTNQNKSRDRLTDGLTDQNTKSRSTFVQKENLNLNGNQSNSSGNKLQQLRQTTMPILSNSKDISLCNSTRDMCNSNTIISGNKVQANGQVTSSTRNLTKSLHSSHQSSSSIHTTQASEKQSPRGPPPVTRMKKLLVTVSPPDKSVENSPMGEILCEDSQSPGYENVTASKKGPSVRATDQTNKNEVQAQRFQKSRPQEVLHTEEPVQQIEDYEEEDLHSSQGFETSHLSPPQNKSQASPSMNKSLMSPSHNSPDPLAIASWGLPDAILNQYHKNKVTHMFPWQGECLRTGRVLDGGNLVYSAPTSAGKTLVAELLIMKRVLETKKKALFILPFVSVSREKMFYLQSLLQDSGIRVDGYMGKQGASGGFGAVDVAVCTIERANSLINRLLEESKLHQLGIIVVDELHMVGDSNRGYLLELLLTKIRYATSLLKETAKQQGKDDNNESHTVLENPIQIVGMSATLPNLGLLAKWLDADLYTTDYRPVPLTETVKIGPTIYDNTMTKLRDFVPMIEAKGDEEHILSLCLETIAEGCSVLVFCPTKNWCEKLSENMAREIARMNGMLPTKEKGFVPSSKMAAIALNRQGLMDTFEQLKRTPAGIDSVLKKTVPYGVAYHHAGLTFDERDIVEGSFRQNSIRILVATSTLSSGVNLPARRVIIRSIMFNRKVLDPLTYKQMAGRAGRKGVDTLGESILICKSTERAKATNLMKTDLPPVQSCLVRKEGDNLSSSMKRAILEVIASGVASSPADVKKYASSTLLASSLTSDPDDPSNKAETGDLDTDTSAAITDCVKFLQDSEFITLQKVKSGSTTHEIFKPSQLGSATLASALTPDEAMTVFVELQRARKSFVLENELHIIYQVTPIYSYGFYPDWYQFVCQWENLSTDKRRVAELIGVEERFLVRAARGNIATRTVKQQHALAIHQRFYTALILNDLVNEMPLNAVARKYACARGQLQSLQQNAATFAGMVTVFCSKLGWHNMELLLNQFQNRLNFGVQRELCDLVRISLLNAYRARLLYNNGLHSVADVANARPTDVEHLLRIAVPFQSSRKAIDEQQYEAEERRQTRCIWATGRKGLTESEAATLIVSEAQKLVQGDLGIAGVQWGSVNQGGGGANQRMDNGQSGVGMTQKHAMPREACGRDGSKEGGGRDVLNEGDLVLEAGKTDARSRKDSTPCLTSGAIGVASSNRESGIGSRKTDNVHKPSNRLTGQIQIDNNGGTRCAASSHTGNAQKSLEDVADIIEKDSGTKDSATEITNKKNSNSNNGSKSVQFKGQISSTNKPKNGQGSGRCIDKETEIMGSNKVIQGQKSSVNQVQRSFTKSNTHSMEIVKDDEVSDSASSKQIPGVNVNSRHVDDENVRGNHQTSMRNQVVVQAEVYATRSQSTNPLNENGKNGATAINKVNPTAINPSKMNYNSSVAKTVPNSASVVRNQPSTVRNQSSVEVLSVHNANMHGLQQVTAKESTPPAISKDLEKKTKKDTSPELFSVPEDLSIQSFESAACSTPNDVIAEGNLQTGTDFSNDRIEENGREKEKVHAEKRVSETTSCDNDGLVNSAHHRNRSLDLRSIVGCHDDIAISSPGGQSDFSPSFPPMDSQMLRLVDEVCAQNDAIAKTASPDLQRNAKPSVNLSKMPLVSFNADLGTLEVNEIDLDSCPLYDPVNTEQILDDAVAMDLSDSFDFPADEVVKAQDCLPDTAQEIKLPETMSDKKKKSSPISPLYSQLQADMELAAHWYDSFSCEENSPQPQVVRPKSTTRDEQIVKCDGNVLESRSGAGQVGVAVTNHVQLVNKLTRNDNTRSCTNQRTERHCNKQSGLIAKKSVPSVGQQTNAALSKSNKPNNVKSLRDRRKSSNCDITSVIQDQFSPGTMAMLDMFAGEDDSNVQYKSMVAPKQAKGCMGNGQTNSGIMGNGQTNSGIMGNGHINSGIMGKGQAKSGMMGNGQTNSGMMCNRQTNSGIMGNKKISTKAVSARGGKPSKTETTSMRSEKVVGESSKAKATPRKSGRKRKSDEFVTNDSTELVSPPKKTKDSSCDENNTGTCNPPLRVSPRRLGKPSENDRTPEGSDERRTSDGDFIPPTPPEKPNTPKLVKGTLKKNGKTPQQRINASSGVESRRSSQRIRTQVKRSQVGQAVRGKGGAVNGPSRTAKKTLHLSPPDDSQALFSERDCNESQLCDMNKALDASDLDLRLDISSDSASSPKDQPNLTMPSSPRMHQSSPTIPCTDGAFTIIDVCSNKELFETFLEEWRSQMEYSFSLACETYQPPVEGGGIGGNFRRGNSKKSSAKPDGLVIEDEGMLVTGLAVCWGDKDAYFISFQNTPSQDADESLAQPTPDPDLSISERLQSVKSILEMVHCGNPGHSKQRKPVVTKMVFDLKQQYKALARSCGTVLGGTMWDPKVAHWLFDPGAKEKNIQGLVTQYLPQETHLIEDIGGGVGVGGLGVTAQNPGSGRLRASTESVLVHMLMRPLNEQLKDEGLHKSFVEVEMPSQVTIARMELNGFGFSLEECESQKTIMQAKLTALEEQAYQMAGHGFVLTSPDEIAQVLYAELKLPPNGDPKQANTTFRKTLGARGRLKLPKHFSTSKDALEKLKPFHKLPGLILEWRRIAMAVTKVIFPLQNEKVYNEDLGMNRIYGLCQLHTATGRVAMSDPNLQSIPKDFEIQMPSIIGESPPQGAAPAISCLNAPTPLTRGRGRRGAAGREGIQQKAQMGHGSQQPSFAVSVRHAFCPFPGGVLLAADYSQLELRILAHLAKDSKLTAILNSGGDVFKQIAAKWKNTGVEDITAEQRQQAKQVCYGMIYGIGAKALGETLGVGEDDGGAFMETFKMQYKGMRTFMTSTVKECREKGYVTTMTGRRRYLPAITNTNAGARNHAERQAINTTIQGSAADLVKTAMNNIDRRLVEEFPNTRRAHRHKEDPFIGSSQRRPNRRTQQSSLTPSGAFLVLQLHDELIYEVHQEDVIQVAQLVKIEMESAIKLSVRLPVKVNAGPTWGSMEMMDL